MFRWDFNILDITPPPPSHFITELAEWLNMFLICSDGSTAKWPHKILWSGGQVEIVSFCLWLFIFVHVSSSHSCSSLLKIHCCIGWPVRLLLSKVKNAPGRIGIFIFWICMQSHILGILSIEHVRHLGLFGFACKVKCGECHILGNFEHWACPTPGTIHFYPRTCLFCLKQVPWTCQAISQIPLVLDQSMAHRFVSIFSKEFISFIRSTFGYITWCQ